MQRFVASHRAFNDTMRTYTTNTKAVPLSTALNHSVLYIVACASVHLRDRTICFYVHYELGMMTTAILLPASTITAIILRLMERVASICQRILQQQHAHSCIKMWLIDHEKLAIFEHRNYGGINNYSARDDAR
eukprot:2507-Heterococcus_DN1.PRE.3